MVLLSILRIMNKTISCIIATHNRDDFLKDAIHSIIKQTYKPLEIIVANNIPNEKTKKVVDEISINTSIPIHYFEHNMKGTGPVSMNLAASKANGDYIAFLNDDDMWEIDYLKNIFNLISEKKSKIIYAWIYKLQNNVKTEYKKLVENLEVKDFLLLNPGSGVSNLVVDKELFIGIGGFDEYIYSNDKDFIMRAIYYGYDYNVLKEFLVIHRKHDLEQLTDFDKDFLIGMKKFFKKHEFAANFELKTKFWIKYWKMYVKLFFSH